MAKTCSVENCGKKATAKGLCPTHYQAQRRLETTGKRPQRAAKGDVDTALLLRLSDTLKEQIKALAEQEGVSVAVWVRKALEAQVLRITWENLQKKKEKRDT
jgi:predicted HicB family RNase H-like nuclease